MVNQSGVGRKLCRKRKECGGVSAVTSRRERPRRKRAIGNKIGRPLFDAELNIAFGGQLMKFAHYLASPEANHLRVLNLVTIH